MNEKRVWVFCFMISVLLLGACGGDSTSNVIGNGLNNSGDNADGNGGNFSGAVAGILTDSRDGQTYRTVKIGHQLWMAENLNYKVKEKKCQSWSLPGPTGPVCMEYKDEEISRCYNFEESNCEKYGRLYMIAYVECPDGWHLPTKAEFETLFSAVGGKSVAGKMLKSKNGWNSGGNGTDAYSFAALPAGYMDVEWDSFSEGAIAEFWTSSGFENVVEYVSLKYDEDSASIFGYRQHGINHDEMRSVRCVNIDAGSEYDVAANTLKDLRDDKIYRTVKIGSQTWMAENLNYEGPYYKGPYYFWGQAMDQDGYFSKNGRECANGRTCSFPVRGICPYGWHLPTDDEWDLLTESVGENSIAGKMLKSTSGWPQNGTDAYSFTVIYPNDGSSEVEFWSSTEIDSEFAVRYAISSSDDFAGLSDGYKGYPKLIRCVKDAQ